jgi:hypothetical protein
MCCIGLRISKKSQGCSAIVLRNLELLPPGLRHKFPYSWSESAETLLQSMPQEGPSVPFTKPTPWTCNSLPNDKVTIRPRFLRTVPEIRLMSRTHFVPDLLNELKQSEKQETVIAQSV